MRNVKLMSILAILVIAAVVFAVLMAGCGQQKAEIEKQREIARLIVEEAWNKGNLGVLDEQYAPDLVYHQTPFPDIKGLAAYKQYVQKNRTTYPDLKITLEDVIVEGDKSVLRGTYTGTQKGVSPTLGISTGKPVNFNLCMVSRSMNGKIVEVWAYVDWQALMQQSGYKMSPPITETTFARLHIHQFKPEKMAEVMHWYRNRFVPVIKSQNGFRGLYGLTDDKTGKSVSITLWDSEADAMASMQAEDYKALSKEFADKFKGAMTAKDIREGYTVTVQE